MMMMMPHTSSSSSTTKSGLLPSHSISRQRSSSSSYSPNKSLYDLSTVADDVKVLFDDLSSDSSSDNDSQIKSTSWF